MAIKNHAGDVFGFGVLLVAIAVLAFGAAVVFALKFSWWALAAAAAGLVAVWSGVHIIAAALAMGDSS